MWPGFAAGLLCALLVSQIEGQETSAQAPRLKIRPGATYLETTDGKPFFWLGDTVWSGPAAASLEDWHTFLKHRQSQHFSVIQFNAVCPWRVNPTDADGQAAYTGKDPIQINERYFARLDRYFDAIEQHGLVAAPVLIWAHRAGDAGVELSEPDLIRLAKFQVERYRKRAVAWILAGDNRYTPDESARWQRVGRAVFADHPDAVVTTHPTGVNWPWDSHKWRDEKWLSFLGYQSGHGDGNQAYAWLHSGPPAKSWSLAPAKPILNLEPPYEDHLAYQSRKPHSAYSVRRACYWSLLVTPPAGLTYGGHGIWSWETVSGKTPADHSGSGPAKAWPDAMKLPGSTQVGLMADMFRSLDWWKLRPAQALLAGQFDANDPAKFVAVAGSEPAQTVVAYLPVGSEILFTAESFAAKLNYEWFDPRTGTWSRAEPLGQGLFRAPTTEDWVLVAGRRNER